MLVQLKVGKLHLPINRNMRCIEICDCTFHKLSPLVINRNMRCIEITVLYWGYPYVQGLIET